MHDDRGKTIRITLDQAAEAMRDAMRSAIRRNFVFYLLQGVLLIVTGVFALIFPVLSTVAVIFMIGWLLVISAALQAVSLAGSRHAPHFWLQLVSAGLALLVGLLILLHPGAGILSFTLLLLVYFMISGIAKVVFALTIKPFPNWGWVLASGIVGIAVSFVLWSSMPLTAIWLLGVLLGIQLISEGLALTYMAWSARRKTAPPPSSIGSGEAS
jgi:uncharacterized membrane protein HdeD (DUF308 family)